MFKIYVLFYRKLFQLGETILNLIIVASTLILNSLIFSDSDSAAVQMKGRKGKKRMRREINFCKSSSLSAGQRRRTISGANKIPLSHSSLVYPQAT